MFADDLIRIWERGQWCHPAERALRLLSVALPDRDRAELAGFDAGLRDWHLLRLRQALFGPVLVGVTECAQCGERLEVECDTGGLAAHAPPAAPVPFTSRSGRQYRLPTLRDLRDIASDPADAATATAALFARCALDDAPAAAPRVEEFDEVDAGLGALAAARAIRLDLACEVCGHTWRDAFEPAEFLWSEIAAQAAQVFDEVHRLASAYGWREHDILAMSDARRAAYLSRVS
jgi:hypothetical protein